MNCLRPSKIYDFLEKEISPDKIKTIEEHLLVCSVCRHQVEERHHLLEACNHLPDLPLPLNWAKSVMAKILQVKAPSFFWLIAILASLSLLLSGLGWLAFSFEVEQLGSPLSSLKLATYNLIHSFVFLITKVSLVFMTSLKVLLLPLHLCASPSFQAISWLFFNASLFLIFFTVISFIIIFYWRHHHRFEENHKS